MSNAEDRQNRIIGEINDLRDFYRAQKKPEFVTMFQEDFDWMKKRKQIAETPSGFYVDSIRVLRGPRKRPARKRRPKESLV